ncbi:serine hydrolase [Solibacillus sp. FSL H8-0523]|uniref:serine hydrolase n=1 Tax=Solibacillus sp. FSL H8-0523 TaxID=2954511 RepID=UPI003101247F
MKPLQALLNTIPFKVHVAVQHYHTNETFEQLADDVFSSASVIKVPILLAILKRLQTTNGNLRQVLTIADENLVEFSVLTEQQQKQATLHELLLWMTITSDNSATNACIDFLGMDAFNTYFAEIGMQHTKLQRKMMDFERQQQGFDNETTANDMKRLFQALYEGQLLDEAWTAIAFDILCRQRSHESLRRYLVDDVKVAHKTGGLDTVDHDCGIVFHKNGAYFIGVFLTGVTDNEKAKSLIGQISKIVYEEKSRVR